MGENSSLSSILPNLALWLVLGALIGVAIYAVIKPPEVPSAPSPQAPQQPAAPAQPAPLPSNISVILLSDSTCKDCNDSALLSAALSNAAGSLGLTVSGTRAVDSSSAEGKAIVSKYKIGWLPAVLVSWEANSSAQFLSTWVPTMGTRESDGTFVYRNVYPPYHDLENGIYAGFVEFIGIDVAKCPECANATTYRASVENPNMRVVLSGSTVLDSESAEAKALIAKYNITALPTFLLSPDAMAYRTLSGYWTEVEAPESDGWLVFRRLSPPYYDTANGTVAGRLSLVELTASNCTECYNVSIHRESLVQSFRMTISNRTSYDIGSAQGKALVKKYNITAVPTVLVSPDAVLYPQFASLWAAQGNSMEKDGWFVFRDFSPLAGSLYLNLSSGKVENATASADALFG